jgi:glycosyltransferase involved in cell wall biosynthesis
MRPMVSVVIATHNKMSRLERTLKTLCLQKEKRFEVLLCNDAGDAAAEELCRGFADRLSIAHLWATPQGEAPRGAGRTRNAGLRKAKGDRVLIIDDDCLCPADIVGAHASFGAKLIGVVGFRRHVAEDVHERLTDNDLGDIKAIPARPEMRAEEPHLAALLKLITTKNSDVQRYLWTCHISYPTLILRRIGGFWEAFTGSGCEDCELGLRAFRAGVRYHVLHDPSVYHQDHEQSPLQADNYPNNRRLFYQTRDNRRVIVRNGGPMKV